MSGPSFRIAGIPVRVDLTFILMAFLLGLPALLIRESSDGLSPDLHTILTDLVFVNVAWSVLNLLPILPLDGGRVSAALWALGTRGEGRRQAHVLSIVVAGAGAAYALARGYPFGAVFAG